MDGQSAASPPDGGDRLRQVFETYYESVYRYLYARVGNRADAEDLTSQVFLKAVRWLEPEAAEPAVRVWLFRAAQSTVAQFWEEVYRMARVPWDDATVAPLSLLPVEDLLAVERANVEQILRALPERYRQVLILRFLEGRSVVDTAMALGLTEANVKVIQYRALRKAARLEVVDDDAQAT